MRVRPFLPLLFRCSKRPILQRNVFSRRLTNDPIARILHQVKDNSLSIQDAHCQLAQIKTYQSVLSSDGSTTLARIDHSRQERTGMPEVIFAEGKTPDHVAKIFSSMIQNGLKGGDAMATRVPREMFEWLTSKGGLKEHLTYFPDARICCVKQNSLDGQKLGRKTAVVSAGTSDFIIAEEAAVTMELQGYEVTRLNDVGVAGIHRLLINLHRIQDADAIICVAGMDGALPSVLGGLVRCPVVAVPTSVGYGACFSGIAPLLTMLNSCAPGVAVMNIDNGFGAAVFIVKMLQAAAAKS